MVRSAVAYLVWLASIRVLIMQLIKPTHALEGTLESANVQANAKSAILVLVVPLFLPQQTQTEVCVASLHFLLMGVENRHEDHCKIQAI